jgi:hypothetical protein
VRLAFPGKSCDHSFCDKAQLGSGYSICQILCGRLTGRELSLKRKMLLSMESFLLWQSKVVPKKLSSYDAFPLLACFSLDISPTMKFKLVIYPIPAVRL